MQINSTRINTVSETPPQRAGIGVRSGGQTEGTPKAQMQVRLPQLERYNRWAMMGETQQRLADAQGSEHALSLAYRQLKQLERQLAQSGQTSSQIQQQLAALNSRLSQGSGLLDGELKPTLLSSQARQASYVLDRVDLLSAKPAAERLQLFFPASGRGAIVDIPAGAQGEQVVTLLQQGLHDEQIRVSRNEQGQLQFSLPRSESRKLEEPVLFSGQGIRVPAGEPVAIRLTPAQSELEKMGEGLSRGEVRQEQARLQRLLATIEHSMRDLKKFRQQMLAQLEQVKARTAAMSEQELQQLESQLQEQLQGGDFSQTLSGLVAQANVSRQNVVALLSDGSN